jgi:ABC-2 type transport system permease protein
VGELVLIYRKMAGARIRADWQYRTPFVLYTLTQGLITFIDFLEIAVIFSQVDELAGWSVAEVAFLYGVSNVSFHIGDAFISQAERAPQRAKTGGFDLLLIRPLGPLFQLCADDFAFRRLGKLVQAFAVLIGASIAVDVSWSIDKIAVFVMMMAAGTVIFSAIWVITSAFAMWILDATEIMNSFTYGSAYATEYPLPVLTTWLRRLFTFVVPAAFVNYFPSLYLLDKTDPFGAPGWFRFASPFVAFVLVIVARWAWGMAIRHYRSTGS